MVSSSKKSEPAKPRRPPGTTVEARENQMIALAVDLAEQQLEAGTASSQVMTHYLKLGTVREQLEREKLRGENLLLAARAENLASSGRIEEMYNKALGAMRTYKGQDTEDEFDE